MTNFTIPSQPQAEKPERDYCDPQITSAVEQAYEAVWAILQHADPSNGAKTECERKAELSQTDRRSGC